MTAPADDELYSRGSATVVGSWQAYAQSATDAAVLRLPGVAAAVFRGEPERSMYNNALLERHLAAGERTEAVEAMEAAYASAGVTRFAAWVHEGDQEMRSELERRGYALDLTTRAMGTALDSLRPAPSELDLATLEWEDYLRIFELPPGLLSRADHAAFRLLVARSNGEEAATAIAFDVDGDCGIYNVATLERFRRRGLGTALTTLHLHEARARGCRTASLQATHAAERMYAAVGFRDLGRIFEYVPSATPDP